MPEIYITEALNCGELLLLYISCIILHYNMYYFHFTLQEPCQTYLSFSRSFSMPWASFSMLDGPGGSPVRREFE